ncbi:tRNA threonylcarbamoyladenosine dehydratase 2 [[Candida] jaroonii]|uniref:tRNA threonylcarbamoyladenosine dehydratase 2 n=1 Tax=[Candida] jaroonii TaxID=467808 RepID=A0ACA9YCS5_9ASCO|nr:tRNA threonylcarbamoyladenosine dehydratase 2 [[Candida] jaroonii]
MSKIWSVAVATAITTALIVEGIHYYLDTSRKQLVTSENNQKPVEDYPEDLIKEQLARNIAFLGEEGMDKVRNQNIVVVGAGGVGSWVATVLVRSGVGKIRVIDFDQVTLSSLNRHAVANLKDVGISKVQCLKNHLVKVAPWVKIEVRNELWNLKSADDLIFGDDFNPTYIVDCIDNIDTKVDLLAYCYEKKLLVVSSGGAACKSDPSRINIGDISKTEEDPLTRSVRIRLKKKGIVTNIPTIFSAEKPDPRKAQLLPLSPEEIAKGKVDELAALQRFRVRILPVLGTMPGMYGLSIATYVITSVAGYPIEPVEGKNRIKVYDGIFQSLAGQQTRIGKVDQRVKIALSEVPYILEEIFHGKSPISNYSTKLTLSRWDPSKEISCQNLVIMTKEEQSIHEKRVLIGGEKLEDVYSQEVLDLVAKRFEDERYWSQFR